MTDSQREVFETANRYHFIHTLALLAVPLTNRPNVVCASYKRTSIQTLIIFDLIYKVGSLLLLGTIVFSGTCYVHGVTGNTEIIKYTPYGGMALIAAWLSMII